jgi:hypothetical protein
MSEPRLGRSASVWVALELWARFDKSLGRWIAGNSTLDVWSSGITPQEAVERVSAAITLFLDEATEMGTVWEILKSAGVQLQESPEPPPASNFLGRLIRSFAYRPFVPAVFQISRQAA